MILTKQQQVALKRIYDRETGMPDNWKGSYLNFRRTVQQGYDCIMIKWCGMWLGIEKDGYTHS